MPARPAPTRRARPFRGVLALAVATASAVVTLTAATQGVAAASSEIYLRPADGTFDLDGRGWGHGRGMSQWGAQGAATQGLSATQILDFYYPGTAAVTQPAGTTLRVLISRDEGTDTRVLPATNLAATDVGRGDATRMVLPTSINGMAVTDWRGVHAADDALHLQPKYGGDWHPFALGGRDQQVGPIRFTADVPLRLVMDDGTSRSYRGAFDAALVGSTLRSINVVSYDDYLRSVVPSESPSSWKPAALQAQAVAARTYAASEAHDAASSSAAWDICDTTSCQVYSGVAAYDASGGVTRTYEASSTNQAVADTAGQIRTYNGIPAFTQFSSSNGGWTVDGGKPYLPAKADPYDGVVPNSEHAWTATLSVASVESAYSSIGSLQSLTITGRDGHGEFGGRITTLRFDGSAGSVSLTGDQVRSRFGLKSTWWRVTGSPPTAPKGVTAVAGDQAAAVSWSPPDSPGSSPVTSYRVVATPGGAAVTASPPRPPPRCTASRTAPPTRSP